MQNTLDNKSKFFAQYWGQRILKLRPKLMVHVSEGWDISTPDSHIVLTPLSKITDEDAIEVARLHYGDGQNYVTLKEGMVIANNLSFDFVYEDYSSSVGVGVIDYLRSKGYALGWMGLSVGQQIDFGWIKLNE